jgi:exopolysaccharide biosynthesis polyprenyl glycosylphosphotransferase
VRAHATDWVKRLQLMVTLTDAVVVVFAAVSTHTLWFGFRRVFVSTALPGDFGIDYLTFSVGLVLAWMLVLAVGGTRDSRILGTDSTEYRRIVNTTLALFGSIAVIAAMTQTDIGRGYLVTAFPLGLTLLLLSRWLWRRWLHARRRRGELSFRVLLIGNAVAVRELIQSLAVRTDAGYRVIAAVLTDTAGVSDLAGVPVYATADDYTLVATRPDTVIVVGSDASSSRINELSWRLDPGQQLVVAPQLVGVAGSRIHTRPVSGLPLIHVETPSYDGPKRFAKRAFDLVFALGLLIVLAPVFVAVAVVIKVTSRGPVFYGQERIGLSGEPFTMLKFRSMVTDADAHLAELLAAQGTGDAPLFKVKDDPRVTRAGRVLRRYSIDELPQLLNVFKGDMSLVGPRPQRDGEVRLYDSKAGRRLVVKPGMSGLWQVSGRSNLSWEDAIRLDLYYVENWSITNDIIILLRTARAVVGADGAY